LEWDYIKRNNTLFRWGWGRTNTGIKTFDLRLFGHDFEFQFPPGYEAFCIGITVFSRGIRVSFGWIGFAFFWKANVTWIPKIR